jgi:hypothetical protein
MKLIYALGLVLFAVGLVVNFLPTLIYFATVYPNLKDSLSERGAFLEYYIERFPVLIVLNESFNMVFTIESTMIFRPFNENCLEYDVYITVEKINYAEVKSIRFNNMTLCRENPVYNFFFIEPGVNTVNITGKLFELHRPPYNYIGVATREFLLYAKDYIARLGNGSVYYVELADGRKILLDEYVVQDKEDPLVKLLLQAVCRGDEEIAKAVEKHNIEHVGNPIVVLRDGDVKPSLDIGKRLLLDLTYTFFPINLALIMIGIMLIIIARRRVVR